MATFNEVVRDYLARTAQSRKIPAYNELAKGCYFAAHDLPKSMAKAAGVAATANVALAPKTLEMAAKFLAPHESKLYALHRTFEVLPIKWQHTPKLEGFANKKETVWNTVTNEQLSALQESARLAPGLIRIVAQTYGMAAMVENIAGTLYPLHTFLAGKGFGGLLPKMQAAVVTNKAPEFVFSDKQTLVYFLMGTFDDYGNVPLAKQMAVLADLQKDGVKPTEIMQYRDHYRSLPPGVQLNIGYLNPLRWFSPNYEQDKEVIDLLEKINGVAIYAKYPDMCRSAQKIYNALGALSPAARNSVVARLLRLGEKKTPKIVVHLADNMPQLFDLGSSVKDIKALACRGVWQDAAKILPTLYVAWLKNEAAVFNKELTADGRGGSVSSRVLTAFSKWCATEESSVQGLFSPAFEALKKDAAASPVHAALEFFSFIEDSSVLSIDPELLSFILRTKVAKKKVRDFSSLRAVFDSHGFANPLSADMADEDLIEASEKPIAQKPLAQKPVAQKTGGVKPSVKPPAARLQDQEVLSDEEVEALSPSDPRLKLEPVVDLTELRRSSNIKKKLAEERLDDEQFFGVNKRKPKKNTRALDDFEPVSFDEDPDAALFKD